MNRTADGESEILFVSTSAPFFLVYVSLYQHSIIFIYIYCGSRSVCYRFRFNRYGLRLLRCTSRNDFNWNRALFARFTTATKGTSTHEENEMRKQSVFVSFSPISGSLLLWWSLMVEFELVYFPRTIIDTLIVPFNFYYHLKRLTDSRAKQSQAIFGNCGATIRSRFDPIVTKRIHNIN